jgi:hypothetical protein
VLTASSIQVGKQSYRTFSSQPRPHACSLGSTRFWQLLNKRIGPSAWTDLALMRNVLKVDLDPDAWNVISSATG